MRKRLKNHFIPHEGNDYKPHFVREKNIISLALIAIAIFGLAFSTKTFLTRHPDLLSAVITSVLVDLTNTNRLSQNISPLTFNDTLAYSAQLKANDMAEKSYFAHTSPEGKSPWYWFTEGGYKFIYAGENLAVNFIDSGDVVTAWMNSAGHRANILNGNFTEIGIALAPGTYNGRESIYVVQLFGRPAPVAQVPAPVAQVPAPVAVVSEETEEPTPILTVNTPTPASAVAAASAENIQVLAESELFIAVQNNDYVDVEEIKESSASAVVRSSTIEKVFASPKTLLESIYITLATVVFISLILFLIYKPRRTHTKHIVYMILLFILIIILLYLSAEKLFPQILIR